jgi:hypothetical protein
MKLSDPIRSSTVNRIIKQRAKVVIVFALFTAYFIYN